MSTSRRYTWIFDLCDPQSHHHLPPSDRHKPTSIMWDLKCIAAATSFTISNILYTIYGIQRMYGTTSSHSHNENSIDIESTHPMHNFTHWKELDPEYIQERWEQSIELRPIMTWARLFGCMAWFWFMVPILQSAWILSRGGKRLVGTHVLLGSVSYTNFFFVFAYTTN